MPEAHHTVYFELRDALLSPECALCALAVRSMRRYFDALGYESVNDPGIRDVIRAARGFCEVHGRMLREAHDALGTAIIHRDIMTSIADTLATAHSRAVSLGDILRQAIGSTPGANGNSGATALAPQEPCPACVRRATMDLSYIDVLVRHLTEDELLPLFRDSAGLCLPHLRLALRQLPDAATFERLKSAQIAIWQRLMAELDEFIRKQDHRFATEPLGEEHTAWSRAVYLVSGQYGLGCVGWTGHD